jgi:AraC-like DNA-binding protein
MIMKYFNDIEFIGWAHRPECNAWVDKQYDYYVVDYAQSGRLLMQIDDNPVIRLAGPVVFLTFPGPQFKFGRRTGYWDHRFISFKGKLADRFAHSGLYPVEKPVIPINAPRNLERAFDELLNYMENPVHGISRAAYLLEGLLLELHEQPPEKTDARPDDRILLVIEKITAAPEENWDLQRLASRSALSYPHFRRLFAAAAGLPPTSFIIAKRMEKAAKLLQQSPAPTLQETAALCGYEDIYYFTKLFTKFHNISPGRYRDNFQLK